MVVSIGGGFSGFALTSAQLLQTGLPFFNYLLSAGVAVAYAAGVYGGLKLIEDEEKGLTILSWYFLTQVPLLVSPVVTYVFSSGATIGATVGTNGINFAVYYGARWEFYLFRLSDHTIAVGLNFFAIWATWYLRRQLARRTADKALEPTLGTGADGVDPPPAPPPVLTPPQP